MSQRYLLALVTLALLAISPAAPVAAAPSHSGDLLSGTWQIKRVCVTRCHGSTSSTVTVGAMGGNVFTARGKTSGGKPVNMVLYRLQMTVLVHGAKDSSLLTIQNPGQRMHGTGVSVDGSTFTSTWQCVATSVPTGSTAGSGQATAGRPFTAPSARGNC